MTSKLLFITLFFIAFAEAMTAQDFQGVAVYKTRTELAMDSTQFKDDAIRKAVQEQLQHQMQREFSLHFNRNESLYTENEKLAKPQVGKSGGIQISISMSKEELYKNTQTKTYTGQQELFGKLFIIKDSLKMPDWKLINEKKSIGDYTCYKATFTKEITETKWSTENNEPIQTKKMQPVTVWYTPQLPVNSGPGNYWGLPGLILEVQDGKTITLCSSITLNPDEEVSIEAPRKGKVVDQQTFNKIQEERMAEMRARSDNGKGLFITKTDNN